METWSWILKPLLELLLRDKGELIEKSDISQMQEMAEPLSMKGALGLPPELRLYKAIPPVHVALSTGKINTHNTLHECTNQIN